MTRFGPDKVRGIFAEHSRRSEVHVINCLNSDDNVSSQSIKDNEALLMRLSGACPLGFLIKQGEKSIRHEDFFIVIYAVCNHSIIVVQGYLPR